MTLAEAVTATITAQKKLQDDQAKVMSIKATLASATTALAAAQTQVTADVAAYNKALLAAIAAMQTEIIK